MSQCHTQEYLPEENLIMNLIMKTVNESRRVTVRSIFFPLKTQGNTHPPENCQCYTFNCLFKGKLDYSIIRTPVNGGKEKSLKGTSLYLSFFETKDIQTPLKTVLVVRQETLIYRNSILVNSPKG